MQLPMELIVCNLKSFIKHINDESGQSTVEFAIVTAALLTMVIALSLIWSLGDNGLFIEHAISSASHHLQEAAAGIVGDVFSC